MIGIDMGISYNSKLKEVRENIAKLSSLMFDMTKIIKAVNSIEKKVENEIKGNYESFDKESKSPFLTESLKRTYSDAVGKLDSINQMLKSEYESYYQISLSYQDLLNKIEKVDDSNISSIIADTKKLLSSTKSSSTIDFNLEKPLVMNIYKLVYHVLKLGLAYKGDSTFKFDSVDIPYIAELIKEDVATVGKDNQEIQERIVEISKLGLDDSYLIDKNLLILLTVHNNGDLIEKRKAKFMQKVDEYEGTKALIVHMQDDKEKSIQSVDYYSKKRKSARKKAIGKRFAIALNTLIVGACLACCGLGAREIAKGKNYKTVTTTYDSSTGTFDTTVDYKGGNTNSVSLTEYSPWDNPGFFRDKYTRNVYRYDLSGVVTDYSDVSKYLTSDLKGKVSFNSKSEVSDTIPDDYGYEENKYIVSESKKDLEDYKVVDRPFLWGFLTLLLGSGVVGFDYYLFKKLSNESLKTLRIESKNFKERLAETTKNLNETNEELKTLDIKCDNLRDDIYSEYEVLPVAVRSSKDVVKAKRKIFNED